MDWWLNPQLSLSRELELQAARLCIKKLSREDLEARLDSAIVHAVTFDNLLRQAMKRIAELELREIASEGPQDKHYQWAVEVLQQLS